MRAPWLRQGPAAKARRGDGWQAQGAGRGAWAVGCGVRGAGRGLWGAGCGVRAWRQAADEGGWEWLCVPLRGLRRPVGI